MTQNQVEIFNWPILMTGDQNKSINHTLNLTTIKTQKSNALH